MDAQRSGRLGRIVGVLSLLAVASPSLLARELTFEERVEAQRAIEQVYWRHRLWPSSNPGAKPPLSVVVPDPAIRAKVEDYLELSRVLETRWQRPLTPDTIQAELDRMIRGSRDPRMLRELFVALDEDPTLIAETLVRPVLARRLARRAYAHDDRFHGALEEQARAESRQITDVAAMRVLPQRYFEQTYVLRSEAPPHQGVPPDAEVVELDHEEWQHRAFDDMSLGRPSELQEDPEKFFVSALLSRAEGAVTIATLSWPKTPFDTWWEAERQQLAPELPPVAGAYALAEPPDTPCEPDTWDTRYFGPGARSGHSAIWTGSEMIIWGGYFRLDTGGRYDPGTDTWSPTPIEGAPTGRMDHTAVWTGTEMIVWGGWTEDGDTASGGRFNPLTNAWSPTSMNATTPPARNHHTAVWTGTEMIVWGGSGANGETATGGRYDPRTDSWTPTPLTDGVPYARVYPQSVWTGSEMLVWGGILDGFYLNSGSRYDPAANSWVPITAGPGVPSPRSWHSMVWTGSEMIVWGGGAENNSWTNTGGRYNPVTDQWTPTSIAGAPLARQHHSALWTGSRMIVWGGTASTTVGQTNTGGRYNPATDSWASTWNGVNVPSARTFHSAIWTGSEMLVWGGQGQGQLDDGARYDPVSNSWVAVGPHVVPLPRQQHSAIWTGAETIVWGGINGTYLQTGGRYDPALDLWEETTLAAAPSRRTRHTAVWTGTEMIVWGGFSQYPNLYLFTGSRYNPATDTWSATSTGGSTPSGRQNHKAIWTGARMVVWGGSSGFNPPVYYNTGGRYDPITNAWAPTSTGANTPGSRIGHSVVWTGSEVIVWGGFRQGPDTYWDTGGRYDPVADTWLATAAHAPEARSGHSAVWTGTEMVVWGGVVDDNPGPSDAVDTGGRYDPVTNVWLGTSTTGAPPPQAGNPAVWIDGRMLVWSLNDGIGAGYDPVEDAWSPISTIGPEPRDDYSAVAADGTVVVWGGSPYVTDVDIYCAAACLAPVPNQSIGVVAMRSDASVELSWEAVAGASAYDVVAGSLSVLLASAGDFTASTTGCLADDVESTMIVDDSVLEAGSGLWYLVRAVNCAGGGSYDEGSGSQVGSRDVEIAAAPVACP